MGETEKSVVHIDPDKEKLISRSLQFTLGQALEDNNISYKILEDLEIPPEYETNPPQLFIVGYPSPSEETDWETKLIEKFRNNDSPYKDINVAVYSTSASEESEVYLRSFNIFLIKDLTALDNPKVIQDIINVVNNNIPLEP